LLFLFTTVQTPRSPRIFGLFRPWSQAFTTKSPGSSHGLSRA